MIFPTRVVLLSRTHGLESHGGGLSAHGRACWADPGSFTQPHMLFRNQRGFCFGCAASTDEFETLRPDWKALSLRWL